MITFRPIDAILLELHRGHYAAGVRFYQAEEWLQIFAHYVRAYRQPKTTYGYPWEIFNRTSAINQTELGEFECRDAGRDASGRLAHLFNHAGMDCASGLFLWRMGIREHKDLYTAVTIPGRKQWFPLEWWANQVARTFKKPGPNPSHPDARWVDRVRLDFSNYWLRWEVRFYFDYPHDGPSSWHRGVQQKRGESMEAFGKRVSEFIETAFEPEDRNGPLYRPERERAWHRVHDGMEALFPWGSRVPPDFAKQIADILCEVRGTGNIAGRFELTPHRLGILKRWAREARKKASREKAA